MDEAILREVKQHSHFDYDADAVLNGDTDEAWTARTAIGALLETGAADNYFEREKCEELHEELTEVAL